MPRSASAGTPFRTLPASMAYSSASGARPAPGFNGVLERVWRAARSRLQRISNWRRAGTRPVSGQFEHEPVNGGRGRPSENTAVMRSRFPQARRLRTARPRVRPRPDAAVSRHMEVAAFMASRTPRQWPSMSPRLLRSRSLAMAGGLQPIDPIEEHLIDAIFAQPRPPRGGLRRRSPRRRSVSAVKRSDHEGKVIRLEGGAPDPARVAIAHMLAP